MSTPEYYEMFNSIMGITSEEVERVTRDGIRLVRAKRRHSNLFNGTECSDSSIATNIQSPISFQKSECKESGRPNVRIKIPSIRSDLLNPNIPVGDAIAASFASNHSHFDYKIIRLKPNGWKCSFKKMTNLRRLKHSNGEDRNGMWNDASGDEPQDAGNADKRKRGRNSYGDGGRKRGSNSGGKKPNQRKNGSGGGGGGGSGTGGNGRRGGKDDDDDDSDRKKSYRQEVSEQEDDATSIETSRTNSSTSILESKTDTKRKKASASDNLKPKTEETNVDTKTKGNPVYYEEEDETGQSLLVFNYDALPSWVRKPLKKLGNTETGITKMKIKRTNKEREKALKSKDLVSNRRVSEKIEENVQNGISDDIDPNGERIGSQILKMPRDDDDKNWVDFNDDERRKQIDKKKVKKTLKTTRYIKKNIKLVSKTQIGKRPQGPFKVDNVSTISSNVSSRGRGYWGHNYGSSKTSSVKSRYKKGFVKSSESSFLSEGSKLGGNGNKLGSNSSSNLGRKDRKEMPNRMPKRIAAETEYFYDNEVSSDSDFDKSDTPSAEDERDAEWLVGEYNDERFTTSQIGPSQVTRGSEGVTTEEEPRDASETLMIYMMPLFTLMRVAGRLPFTVQKNDKRPESFVIDRNSREFRAFFISSMILTSCFISMVFSLITILRAKAPKTVYENILSTELNKYWIETIVTLLSLYFICTWSISVLLEGGIHLGDYLTRWNLSISALKYDVTRGLNLSIILYKIGFWLYAIVLAFLFFFGGETYPFVRESCGFIGLLVGHVFFTELRLNPFYFLFQYLGLLFLLYIALCRGFLHMIIIAYCISLKNAAKRFNIRLAFALRKVSLPKKGKMKTTVSRIIPYEKLWGEHVIITSISRHTGQVFAIALNAFYLTKMIEMVVTFYALTNPAPQGLRHYNDTFLPVSKINGSTPDPSITPVRAAEPNEVTFAKAIYFFMNCMAFFFAISEVLHKAGAAVMNGFGYVRRHGLVLCETIHERRFITSMENSGAPNTDYFIKAGVAINRQFVVQFLGFVLAFYVSLVQFSPSRLEVLPHTVCHKGGECFNVNLQRAYEFKPGPRVFVAATVSTPTTPTTTEATTTIDTSRTTLTPKPDRFVFTPCDSLGMLPIKLNSFAYPCKRGVSVNHIPMFFKKVGNHFDPVPPNCETKFVNRSQPLYNCFGELVPATIRQDDCKIPKLSSTDEKGVRTEAEVELEPFVFKNRRAEMYCCYKYARLKVQARTCNLGHRTLLAANCNVTRSVRRTIYEDLVEREMAALNVTQPQDDPRLDWVRWTECVCQDLTGIPKNFSYCRNLINDYPPCDEEIFETVPHSEEAFNSTTCSWKDFRKLEIGLKMQILYKRDRYLRYSPIIPSNSCGIHIYNENMALAPYQNGREFDITDCHGQLLVGPTVRDIQTDDCHNLRLRDHIELGQFEVLFYYNPPDEILCCFTWANRANSTVCNLSAKSMKDRCGGKPKSSRRIQAENLFWLEFNDNGGAPYAGKEGLYRNCICQEIGGLPPDTCLDIQPTTTTTTTTTTTGAPPPATTV